MLWKEFFKRWRPEGTKNKSETYLIACTAPDSSPNSHRGSEQVKWNRHRYYHHSNNSSNKQCEKKRAKLNKIWQKNKHTKNINLKKQTNLICVTQAVFEFWTTHRENNNMFNMLIFQWAVMN